VKIILLYEQFCRKFPDEELFEKISKELDPVVKGYTIISWFNQWSSAIIEQFFLSNPKVIPTARRIDKVDFFLS